jgi:hypothetical protein
MRSWLSECAATDIELPESLEQFPIHLCVENGAWRITRGGRAVSKKKHAIASRSIAKGFVGKSSVVILGVLRIGPHVPLFRYII